ncbi:MAG: hypothetical protein RLY97_1042 [Pseudomonadota bacterium]
MIRSIYALRSVLLAGAVLSCTNPVYAKSGAVITADASTAEFAEAPTIIVTATPKSYDADVTSTATKTKTPLIDVPQSVTTVTRQQLDDQAIGQLNDALRYVPGVVLNRGEGHRDQVALRGQSTTADFFLDGLRDDAQYYRSLYNVERVEVLKGPNAMVFGRGGGGGIINRVSKTATLGKSLGAISAGAGTFGEYALAADVNQALSANAALRVNGTYESFNNHRDAYNGHFTGIAPTLALKLGAATNLTVAYEYAGDRRVTDRGVPSLGGAPILGYDTVFFGDTTLNRNSLTAHIGRARLDHQFTDNLSANFSGEYTHYNKYYGNVVPGVATASTVSLSGYNSSTVRDNWIAQGNLIWTPHTGSVKHTLLLGFEVTNQDTDATRQEVQFAKTGGGFTSSVIVPLAQKITFPAASFTAISRSSLSHIKAASAYIQDQIELGRYVQIIAGLRYDDFRMNSLNRINNFTATRSDGTWSPRVGLILKPQPNMSIYASYAKSFLPQSGDQFTVLDASTASLAPEQFRNLETGVKWDIHRDLSFTAAVFQLDRNNTRANDPLTGNVVITGSSRTKGFEAALTGKIAPHLQATLGYALQDGEIRSTTTAAPAGRKLPQVPRHQITAWAKYDVTAQFGFGLGLVHQSSQFATISNSVVLPSFTRLDAAIYAHLNKAVTLQLNVENLTNTGYYPSAGSDTNIMTGEPIHAKLTARIKF